MAFVVTIIAGLGSIRGLIMAGILLGVMINFVSYLLSNEWSYLIAFIIAILILSIRPRGLFGVRKE